jgi:hypothetical protein
MDEHLNLGAEAADGPCAHAPPSLEPSLG